jgi:hypothetical protein
MRLAGPGIQKKEKTDLIFCKVGLEFCVGVSYFKGQIGTEANQRGLQSRY